MNSSKLISILIIAFAITFSDLDGQQKSEIIVDKDIQLIHLKDSVFVHVTWYNSENYGRFPSNGMLIIRNGKVLMVDTPMDNDLAERLHNYIKDSLSANLTTLVVGHFHKDCLGGLDYLQKQGIESIANYRTIETCRKRNIPVPDIPFSDSLIIDFQGKKLECRFFGPGHSFDNITLWVPDEKILFGGCLIKSMDATRLGNLSDAVVPEWDKTVEKIMLAYPDLEWVIPGHGEEGGMELLTHTIELVRKFK